MKLYFRVTPCRLYSCLLAGLMALVFSEALRASAATNDALIFSFFRGNGEEGLFLAASTNGLDWAELKSPVGKSFLAPTVGGKIMRDPCLRLGPDGVFRLVWTTSWRQPAVFGYAESRDLVNWSEVKAVPVMENDPGTLNVWAPELFYDATNQQWIVFWASTVPGKFLETKGSGDNDYNHRMYCVTTKDFRTFSPTRLFYDGGFNVIDATILPAAGKFYLVVKDETKIPVKKHLRLAMSLSAAGPYGPAGDEFTASWVEGPSAIFWQGEFVVYFDHYGRPQHYGGVKSVDLKNWRDITKLVSFPKGARHGTVEPVPWSVIQPFFLLPFFQIRFHP